MRRRRLYIVLLVLLFVCIAAKNQSLFTREQVKKGKEPGTFNGGWYSLISKEVNDKRIKLKIDGRKVKAKKASVIMTDEGEFMVPVSFLPDYFSCAARIYDKSRLVMERNTIYAEMKDGESRMTLNGAPVTLKTGLLREDNILYVTLEAVEARELIEKAKGFTDEECEADLEEAKKWMAGIENTPDKNVKDFARLYKAYRDYVRENGIGALSSRCWPDFFTSFGTPVCSVLSLLNASGIPSSCESDVYGALSMYIGSSLTGKAVFFGDPVSMDEREGTITYWHCGMAACSLARKDTGAQVGVHPNRKIGPTMDFGCAACEHVTVFRVGRKPDGTFRFFIARGEALDKPKQFNGTSIVVKTEMDAKEVVHSSVKAGWEPHFVVIYGDVAPELEKLANMTGAEICRY